MGWKFGTANHDTSTNRGVDLKRRGSASLLCYFFPQNLEPINQDIPAALQASKGKPEMVSLLLQNGADVNAQDRTGSTALHRAASA
eukprot:scaffold147211_cov20-Tisochrysis_lutea.AAC.1